MENKENQNEKKELFTKVKTLKLPNRDLDVLICNIQIGRAHV